jgi:hypothetical protein
VKRGCSASHASTRMWAAAGRSTQRMTSCHPPAAPGALASPSAEDRLSSETTGMCSVPRSTYHALIAGLALWRKTRIGRSSASASRAIYGSVVALSPHQSSVRTRSRRRSGGCSSLGFPVEETASRVVRVVPTPWPSPVSAPRAAATRARSPSATTASRYRLSTRLR